MSCASVSCLINTEPLELLRLQPSELMLVHYADWLITVDFLFL